MVHTYLEHSLHIPDDLILYKSTDDAIVNPEESAGLFEGDIDLLPGENPLVWPLSIIISDDLHNLWYDPLYDIS